MATTVARSAIPLFIPDHTLSKCGSLDMRRPGSIRRVWCSEVRPGCPVFSFDVTLVISTD
jgi:hypothetical protein